MPQSYGFLIHEKPNIIIVLPYLTPMLAGIISACRKYLNRNENLMICILSHRWCSIVKEFITKDDTVLSSGNIVNTVVWKEISNDYTVYCNDFI